MTDIDELWAGLAVDLGHAFAGFRRRLGDLTVETKVDRTLLTEADIAIEELIVGCIRRFDDQAVIVAEEDNRTTVREDVLRQPDRVWVIDPIDGTAEFVRSHGVEFCSVVCLVDHMEPVAAFVLAPELGFGREPILVVADRLAGLIKINGRSMPRRRRAASKCASVTRSAGAPPRPFEAKLVNAGYELKTRTTSQTLDMVRTALDVASITSSQLSQFDLFFRADQKVWDGLAGMCIGATAGLQTLDASGRGLFPVKASILSQPQPTFDTTVMGDPEAVAWFLEIVE